MQKLYPRILIYGYGNPGRQDDILGILLVEEIEKWAKQNNYFNIEVDQNYQLNIEDSEKITHYDVVIFADASVRNRCSYSFSVLQPELVTDFTMHSVKPAFILGLCEKIFGASPETYLLQIRGYKWELCEEITPKAGKNLQTSLEFLKSMITEKYGF
jgi:hydrogenase maturation protease